jgi:hypothetical protein
MELVNKMPCQKFRELYCSCKINVYIVECIHHRYGCSQLCLTLLASCILVACDNYITTRVNVTPN